MPRKVISNWGNYPVVEARVFETDRIEEIRQRIVTNAPVIARGNGRCYGDSSLGENIFSSLKLNKFLSFSPGDAAIECESGLLLDDILGVIVPRGFFLPVTPGTKLVTLGGAIAADVHGKNHHVEGSFSRYVEHIDLMIDDGSIIRCSRTENASLFWKTLGGMGLTGVILSARFRLKPIETAYIDQRVVKTGNISETMKAFDENSDVTYSVAWVDCSAGGKALGRSVLQLGEHIPREQLPDRFSADPLILSSEAKLALPFFMPSFTLNPLSVKAFNAAYYNRPVAGQQVVHYDPFFYPLDSIRDWNRAYGRQGFVQYQFVLPLKSSSEGIVEILERVRKLGEASPLAVLKLFGDAEPEAVMSFPMKGYTLTLDMKATAPVFDFLDQLDEVVAANGGRIYLAKDARMSPQMFNRTYPRRVAAAHFRSRQAERLGNVDE